MSFTIFQNEKTPFQAIKTRSLKSQKVEIFPKGLTHCFGSKMAIFSSYFSQAIYYRKMSFMIFYNEKRPFYAIKTKSLESRKFVIFPNGLTHGFGPKMAIFPTFFEAIQGRKMSIMIFQNEKTPFQAIKTKSLKSRKIDPWFWSTNGHFSNIFFQIIQVGKMSFMIFQIEKTPFQAIKTRS